MYGTVMEKATHYFGESRMKVLNQLVRYFGVALVGLMVDFGTLIFLREVVGVYYLLAAAGGFVAGLAVNYTLSIKYVFKNSKLNSKVMEFMLFGVVGLIGLGVLSASMWVLVSVAGMQYILAKCLATIVVYIWNFIGRKAMYRD